MKKLVTLIILSFVFSFSYGQEKNFQLGLQLSPQLGWIKPDNNGIESEGVKFGFNYGITGDFNIAENYSISTGINIISTGGSLSYPEIEEVSTANNTDTLYGRTENDFRLKYIQVPISLKLKTNQIGYWTYYGQFGLGLAVNYSAKADINFSSPSTSSDLSIEDADFADQVNLFRASLIVGAGAEYNISGNTSLVFGLTFDNGFTNIFDFDGPLPDGNGNATTSGNTHAIKGINNFITLNVGVLF